MKRIFFAILIGLNLTAGLEMARAQSQSDDKPTPQAPYLAEVPDYGHWVVTFKYDPSTPPASGAATAPAAPTSGPTTPPAPVTPDDNSPTAIDTIKTGDLRGIVFTYASGKTQQYTCQGDWVLTSTAKGPSLGIAARTPGAYMDYMTGFIFLNEVKVDLSTFKEAAPHNGVMALHYKSGKVNVWIDPATMLPQAVKREGVEADYQFLNPPPRPFDIPKDQSDLLHKEEQAYKATSSMR